MKIERITHSGISLEQFGDIGDKYNLTLLIHHDKNQNPPFWAYFDKTATQEPHCGYLSKSGRGYTEEEAIKNYASLISNKILVIDCLTDKEKKVSVPLLILGE